MLEEKYKKLDLAIEKYKAATEKSCYAVKVLTEKPDITDNKFGGKPYLPLGEKYPTDKDGNPLALLVQINLKDIDLPDWPNEGVLEIFTDAEVDYPCQYAVKYFLTGQQYQEDLPDVDTSQYIVPTGHKISSEKAVDYMSPNDFRFNELLAKIFSEVYGEKLNNYGDVCDFFEGDYEWMDRLYDEHGKAPRFTIGGYQDFTQSDPRDANETLAKKTETLIKFDSTCENGTYMIGDSGILFTFISPEDLRNKKFENAVVDWDCC